MTYKDEYLKWLNSDVIDPEDKALLKNMENDENEIKECFYQNLAFGTGGLRGILGLGTNRMNKYVVRRATQGIANYIANHGEELKSRGVAIGYDSRHFSAEFALETADLLETVMKQVGERMVGICMKCDVEICEVWSGDDVRSTLC